MTKLWEKKYGGGQCFMFLRIIDHDGIWSCTGTTTWLQPNASLTCAFESGEDLQDVVSGVLDTIERQRSQKLTNFELAWARDILDIIDKERRLWS